MSKTSSNRTPPGWPAEVLYLTTPVYSSWLNVDETSFIQSRNDGSGPSLALSRSMVPARSPPLARPRRVDAPPDHPALGQYGLFASDHLAPGRIVIEYLGFVHSRRDADPLSDYDLSLDRERGIGIDAARMGNEARFINDYRGVRDGPNVEFVDLLVRDERRIGVRVLPVGKCGKGKKGIGKGEELLVNYGKGFWQSRSLEVAAKDSQVDDD